MKKIVYICLLLFAVVACSKDAGSIIGTASADGGNILQGITVKLYDANANFLSETVTDSQGKFGFLNLETGNYYVAATITVNGEIWDTGNIQQMVYVGQEIEKKISLSLSRR